ncbi:MAG: T9SS type A sorting domain-containing protein [Bacteroidetes bacterium]|nr:T9SS type A sorting domain-containing protein [Bacteroidota bacterium]
MKQASSSLLMLLCFCSVHAQDTTWRCTYGGAGYDEGRAVIETSDTNYLVVGATGSFGYGEADVYVLKIDRNGNKIWSNVYGGPNTDWGYSVEETPDSCYIIAGYTNSFGAGGYDVYLLKIDRTGKLLWQKTFGGTDWDLGYSLKITPDSGFAIAGETYSYGAGDADVFLVKTDKDGNLQWQKTYGGNKKDIGRSIDLTYDSGFVLAGETWSYGAGENDVYVIKTDGNGDTAWTRMFGDSLENFGNKVKQIKDSSYVCVGVTEIIQPYNFDSYYFKINKNGSLVWNYTLANTNEEIGYDFIETLDSAFRIANTTNSVGSGGKDLFLLFLTKDMIFQLNGGSYGYIGDEIFYSISLCFDKGLILAGTTNSYGKGYNDVFIMKLDSLGIPINGIPNVNSDTIISFINSPSLQKSIPDVSLKLINGKISLLLNKSIYNHEVSLFIFDIFGRNVFYSTQINKSFFEIDINNLTTGIYFYKLASGNNLLFQEKFLLIGR